MLLRVARGKNRTETEVPSSAAPRVSFERAEYRKGRWCRLALSRIHVGGVYPANQPAPLMKCVPDAIQTNVFSEGERRCPTGWGSQNTTSALGLSTLATSLKKSSGLDKCSTMWREIIKSKVRSGNGSEAAEPIKNWLWRLTRLA